MPKRRRNPYFRRILVGYDGSPQADRAVEVAFSLAELTDCKVLVLAVASLPKPATMVEVRAVLDDARECFDRQFLRISRDAEALNVELTTGIVVGQPVEQIVRRTQIEHTDLIILGHHAKSWFRRMSLESAAGKLLRYAKCPVMLVP
jgi:nucleotide-binding universal stress UspA family protein